jgi:hypothetical protein
MMLDTLLELPPGSAKLKEQVVARLELVGRMSATRDINDAWNQTKKSAAKLYADKFVLDERNVLHWNDGSTSSLDKSISTANFKKLNDLANMENCSVDKMVSKLIRTYSKEKKK